MLIGLAEPGRLLPAGPTATRRVLSLLALTVAAAWLAAQPTQDLAHGNAPVYEPQTAALVSAKIDASTGSRPNCLPTTRAPAWPGGGHRLVAQPRAGLHDVDLPARRHEPE
jgi:hypothetical protein